MSEVPTSVEGPDPLLGKVFDERYRIEETLGQGGIGRVYKARHLTLGRMVALKVLLTQYEAIPVLKQRFQREAEALAALSHPNIVTVTDFGVADHNPYIVMELLEGCDLAELVGRGEPLEPKRALDIVRQTLRALAYAHERDLVHRDLKPHNIFVRVLGDGMDHVHVLDFGLARFMGDSAKSAPKLTRQGALIGTPAYMAPEQASGEEADARADVYAVGCVLFEALTGRRVFESGDPGQVLRSHLLSAPPSLASADRGLECSPALEELVARALEKSPAARFADAKAMLGALDALGPDAAVRVGPRPTDLGPVTGLEATWAGGKESADERGAASTRVATPQGKAATRSAGSSVSLPKSRAPLFVGMGCAALGLLTLIVAAVVAFGGDEEPDPEVVHPVTVPEPLPPEPTPTPPPPARAPARDPFAEPLPAVLRPIHAAAQRGRARNAHTLQLRSYLRASAGDPEARIYYYLLMGHIEAQRRHLSDALDNYREALRIDETVRGDPQMQNDLLEMVCTNDLRSSVTEQILHTYGAEARPFVTAAIEHQDLRRCDRYEHLVPLLQRLPPG